MEVCAFADAHHVGDLAGSKPAEEAPSLEDARVGEALQEVIDSIPELANDAIVGKARKPPRRVYEA